MPKNKKKWIDNKTAETFRLVHRSQRDPLIVDEGTSEHVLQPVEKKSVDEHIKYGIYYDDDYNYLQHLRTANEVNLLDGEERTIVRAPKGKANLASTLFETGGVELNVGLLNQDAEPCNLPALDDDVVAALEGDLDYLDELEDDFVTKLNGGELPSCQPPEPIKAVATGRPRPRMDSDSDLDPERGYSSPCDTQGDSGDEGDDDMEMQNATASHLDSARIIDKQFERLYEEGGSSEDEDEEEPDNMIEPDSSRMKQLVEESKNTAVNLVLKTDEIARRYAYSKDSDEEGEGSGCVSVECPDKKRAKWDCESVLSSYSNIYNHPTVIKESRSTKNHSFKPTGVNIDEEQSGEAMDCEVGSVVNSVLEMGKRRRDETKDEKRERKKAVKGARAERRAEKKANKRAFTETRNTTKLLAGHPTVKHVHIA